MTPLHRGLFVLSVVLLACLCLGLLRRARLRECFSFSAYVAVAACFSLLILVSPDFNTPEAFVVKQGVYDSLLFGMSLELSYRAFAAFTGIAARIRAFLAFSVGASSLGIFVLTPANPAYSDLARYQPGITTAGIWCLAFVALLIVWYQIPVARFTKAIILGYVPYLVVFVVYIDLIGRLGWQQIQNLNIVNALAYDATIGYLAYAAWRKD